MCSIIASANEYEPDSNFNGSSIPIEDTLSTGRYGIIDVDLVSTRPPDPGALELTYASKLLSRRPKVLALGLSEHLEQSLSLRV